MPFIATASFAHIWAPRIKRDPNPFTGFDQNDNIRMHELWIEEKFGRRLLPVVNIALNLVGGSKLAWQERKAESFTVSPLHCGSYELGYRKTNAPPGKRYGGEHGISLGTATTISGAAASPNMGYHSSPLVTFILTLLNVRLGAWLGNPGKAGDATFHLGYPNFSVGPIIAEAFGLTNDTSPYVYLSDGGHFENLGLYEMVLRRCHHIVVSDAGEDPECSFADLGEAVRKIRIDFGIPIEFGPMGIYPRSQIDALEKRVTTVPLVASAIQWWTVPPLPMALSFTSNRRAMAMNRATSTNTLRGAKPSRTRAPLTSSSPNRNLRAIACSARIRWKSFLQIAGAIFARFVRDILKTHLETEADDWLAKLLDAPENENKV